MQVVFCFTGMSPDTGTVENRLVYEAAGKVGVVRNPTRSAISVTAILAWKGRAYGCFLISSLISTAFP